MKLAADGRPGARARGYTVRWQKTARRFLAKHPTCARFGIDPKCKGLAAEVDHIVPHGGDLRLFWDKQELAGSVQGLSQSEDAGRAAIKAAAAPRRISTACRWIRNIRGTRRWTQDREETRHVGARTAENNPARLETGFLFLCRAGISNTAFKKVGIARDE